MTKSTIRAYIKSLAPQIAATNAAKSYELITKQLLVHPVFLAAKTIATYHPLPDEVDLSHLNQTATRLGKTLAYPICHGAGEMSMIVAHKSAFEQFLPHELETTLSPSQLDLILIPCRAFDPVSLHRLGRGAGYYDRYLARAPRATKIIVAYELQKSPLLPTDPHDLPADFAITELTTYPVQ